MYKLTYTQAWCFFVNLYNGLIFVQLNDFTNESEITDINDLIEECT